VVSLHSGGLDMEEFTNMMSMCRSLGYLDTLTVGGLSAS
jgi:hypothetical protein